MNVFYNREGIGDVLIIPIKEGKTYSIASERNGDVVEIHHAQSKELYGFNIFNASNYFDLDEANQMELTAELLSKINNVLKDNGVETPLEVDLTPKFVVGYVKEKEAHENADKLSVCKVDVGDEELQIVCGAPNVEKGQKVVVAKVGATMPSGMVIKEAELRGVPSYGMICSAKELDLPDAPKEKGILVLSDDYKVGSVFEF